jgi:NAD(P)-dependent dehydrogenase (short-subunit alcohol dehydrogenase family)
MTLNTTFQNATLQNQAVLVTGASSGLGRAAALAFAEAGADVALLARGEGELRALAAEIEALGRRALLLPTDLADEGALLEAAQGVLDRFGRVDVLLNNAGTDVPGAVKELAADDWDRVLAVNLRAPFLLAKAVFPAMQAQGRGTIINVSSVAGKRGWANASAYCASKFGLTGLTQALHAEGREHGIRAVVVYPGAMATNWGDWTPEARGGDGQESRPSSEALSPKDAASFLVWLAAAPQALVLTEAVMMPLGEQGWP